MLIPQDDCAQWQRSVLWIYYLFLIFSDSYLLSQLRLKDRDKSIQRHFMYVPFSAPQGNEVFQPCTCSYFWDCKPLYGGVASMHFNQNLPNSVPWYTDILRYHQTSRPFEFPSWVHNFLERKTKLTEEDKGKKNILILISSKISLCSQSWLN